MADLTEWLNLTTGWEFTPEEFLRAGERMTTLKRMYNVRLGQSRKDDVLPARVRQEPLPDGGAAGYLPPFGAMLDEYYAYRGWTTDGIPTEPVLVRLGLEWTAGDLPPSKSSRHVPATRHFS